MKMGPGLFWGLLLIVVGFSIIFKVVFGVNIFRVVVAVFFVLIGIKILIGKPNFHFKGNSDSDVVFRDKRFDDFPTTDKEFSTVFGKSIYDFRNSPVPLNKNIHIEFNTVFGETEIYLPPDLPVKIKAEAVFGAAKLPNNNTAVFGSANYITDHDTSTTDFITIEVHTVFGNTEIRQ
ncbi:MAG: hypothetical protein JXA77_18760 [Bacteroidales bacterium]|nr:hypothetical protein [Bacteroidales bacterium]MBN2818228.1 hypothetical protein [Bacteroidales bacterium]